MKEKAYVYTYDPIICLGHPPQKNIALKLIFLEKKVFKSSR